MFSKVIPNVLQPIFVITHFVGATEQSSSAYALVKRLLDELDSKHCGIAWPEKEPAEGQPKEDPKLDFNSLCLRLSERLGDYAGERRIVILLDALNQLTDGHELGWLPYRLGPSVRVVVNCIEEEEDRKIEGRKISENVSTEPLAKPRLFEVARSACERRASKFFYNVFSIIY